jgi:hypothetical protein
VGAYAAPDDERLPGYASGPVAEGRAAVIVPRHLEHARVGGHAFNTQAGSKRAAAATAVTGVVPAVEVAGPIFMLIYFPSTSPS